MQFKKIGWYRYVPTKYAKSRYDKGYWLIEGKEVDVDLKSQFNKTKYDILPYPVLLTNVASKKGLIGSDEVVMLKKIGRFDDYELYGVPFYYFVFNEDGSINDYYDITKEHLKKAVYQIFNTRTKKNNSVYFDGYIYYNNFMPVGLRIGEWYQGLRLQNKEDYYRKDEYIQDCYDKFLLDVKNSKPKDIK